MTAAAGPCGLGNVTVNVLPRPGRLVSPMEPP